ncbi:nucleotidyltransferase family protein [Siccibacter colletis]|uniref:nucleotidyltransferase family protein n=1 Tax=Siccibacter colletis TaxID=1505757 RepID=UPI003CED2730
MSKNWEKILLSPGDTVRKALQVMNDEALRIAVITNHNRELLGVVTDGDIRRGILNNVSLDVPITELMNPNPIIAYEETARNQIVRMMREKGILALPVIDKKTSQIIGLKTLENTLSRTKYQNPVFIMAGGFGTRLRPLTDDCPKPMLKVGNRPILETLLIQFSEAGFENFYISTHYMPDQITNYFGDGSRFGVKIEYVHEEHPLGTGGALGLLPLAVPDLPLIMINGDVLTTLNIESLLRAHNDFEGVATMCVREYQYQVPYGVIKGEGNVITHMEEKPVQKFFVNAGIYVIEPSVYKSVPRHTKIDMPTLLEKQMEQGLQVMMFPVHEYWLDIGRMDDFERAQKDISYLGL